MPKQLNNNKVGVSLHIVFLKVYIDFYFLISCIPDKIFAVISSLKFIELLFPTNIEELMLLNCGVGEDS